MSTSPGLDDYSQTELLNNLRYGSPREQEEALTRLAAVGDAEALDAVVEYLLEQPPGLEVTALDTLQVLAYKYVPVDRYSLAEVLIPFLSAEKWQHRLAAARLLSTHPNELAVEPLRELIDEAREKIANEPHRRLLPMPTLVERTLYEAIIALAGCGRVNVLPDILDLLEDRSLRPIATRALGVISSETERLRLEDLCEDDDVRVRDAAQWALGLMDERAAQFMLPPDQVPEPPPDRLTPLYWAHRQLYASDDDLVQFLVVRVAIEHLILDAFIGEGRVPEQCKITLRRYSGDAPPGFKEGGETEVVGSWRYYFQGPTLLPLDIPSPEASGKEGAARRGASIIITYPGALSAGEEEGLVGFDCFFGPLVSRGWLYRITRQDEGGWSFTLVRRTWAS